MELNFLSGWGWPDQLKLPSANMPVYNNFFYTKWVLCEREPCNKQSLECSSPFFWKNIEFSSEEQRVFFNICLILSLHSACTGKRQNKFQSCSLSSEIGAELQLDLGVQLLKLLFKFRFSHSIAPGKAVCFQSNECLRAHSWDNEGLSLSLLGQVYSGSLHEPLSFFNCPNN